MTLAIIEPEILLMTDVFWVQPYYTRDIKKFYNLIRRLKARYYKTDTLNGFTKFKLPYSFLNREQYFLFKLSGLEHRHNHRSQWISRDGLYNTQEPQPDQIILDSKPNENHIVYLLKNKGT